MDQGVVVAVEKIQKCDKADDPKGGKREIDKFWKWGARIYQQFQAKIIVISQRGDAD